MTRNIGSDGMLRQGMTARWLPSWFLSLQPTLPDSSVIPGLYRVSLAFTRRLFAGSRLCGLQQPGPQREAEPWGDLNGICYIKNYSALIRVTMRCKKRLAGFLEGRDSPPGRIDLEGGPFPRLGFRSLCGRWFAGPRVTSLEPECGST